MCGIAGLWARSHHPETVIRAEKMADALYHRGPDGRGFHIDARNALAMIHTRLPLVSLGEPSTTQNHFGCT